MATSAHPAAAAPGTDLDWPGIARANPLVLWHLLSVDAPTVAMLWAWFLARANNVKLPMSAIVAMGIAVWLLYAADRLLDSRSAAEETAGLEARHYFHRRYQRGFRIGIAVSSIVLAALLPKLATESLRLYLILSAPLFAYFILIHAGPFVAGEGSRRLPKEFAVGIFFSAAVFVPTVARDPLLREDLLPAAILFAAVCSLNCLFIYAWEHAGFSGTAHPLTCIALRHLPKLAAAAAVSGLGLALASRGLPWPIPAACALSSGLLLVLHYNRHRMSTTMLRAAADLCLVSPILFLPLV